MCQSHFDEFSPVIVGFLGTFVGVADSVVHVSHTRMQVTAGCWLLGCRLPRKLVRRCGMQDEVEETDDQIKHADDRHPSCGEMRDHQAQQ